MVIWPAVVVTVLLLLLAVVLCVQRMVRTAEARRIAASAPAVELQPEPVGAVDMDELWGEIRWAMTYHRIGGDITEGAIREPGRSEWV